MLPGWSYNKTSEYRLRMNELPFQNEDIIYVLFFHIKHSCVLCRGIQILTSAGS